MLKVIQPMSLLNSNPNFNKKKKSGPKNVRAWPAKWKLNWKFKKARLNQWLLKSNPCLKPTKWLSKISKSQKLHFCQDSKPSKRSLIMKSRSIRESYQSVKSSKKRLSSKIKQSKSWLNKWKRTPKSTKGRSRNLNLPSKTLNLTTVPTPTPICSKFKKWKTLINNILKD